jgi:hypothetical protein
MMKPRFTFELPFWLFGLLDQPAPIRLVWLPEEAIVGKTPTPSEHNHSVILAALRYADELIETQLFAYRQSGPRPGDAVCLGPRRSGSGAGNGRRRHRRQDQQSDRRDFGTSLIRAGLAEE